MQPPYAARFTWFHIEFDLHIKQDLASVLLSYSCQFFSMLQLLPFCKYYMQKDILCQCNSKRCFWLFCLNAKGKSCFFRGIPGRIIPKFQLLQAKPSLYLDSLLNLKMSNSCHIIQTYKYYIIEIQLFYHIQIVFSIFGQPIV